MSNDTFEIDVIHPNGARAKGKLIIGTETPSLAHRVHLTFLYAGKKFQTGETDYFSALAEIRRELERMSLLLDCYGASRNVSPSLRQRQENLGMTAAILRLGRPVFPGDEVNVFSTGPDVIPSTVDEQHQFHHRWLESLGWAFDGKGKILSKKISYNPYDPPLGVRVKFGLMDLAAGILSRLRSRRGADEVMPPVSGAMALKH